jgi:hypothetical protein
VDARRVGRHPDRCCRGCLPGHQRKLEEGRMNRGTGPVVGSTDERPVVRGYRFHRRSESTRGNRSTIASRRGEAHRHR